jgi:hypothetical protein
MQMHIQHESGSTSHQINFKYRSFIQGMLMGMMADAKIYVQPTQSKTRLAQAE